MEFTYRVNTRIIKPIVPAGVSQPFKEDIINRSDARIENAKALWDTGATNSCITEKYARRLNLIPVGKVKMQSASESKTTDVYVVHLYFHHNVVLRDTRVLEIADKSDFDIIFGMDIISSGDFAITNYKGKTSVSFRIPSLSEICFEKEAHKAALKAKHLNKNTTSSHRNKPKRKGRR